MLITRRMILGQIPACKCRTGDISGFSDAHRGRSKGFAGFIEASQRQSLAGMEFSITALVQKEQRSFSWHLPRTPAVNLLQNIYQCFKVGLSWFERQSTLQVR